MNLGMSIAIYAPISKELTKLIAAGLSHKTAPVELSLDPRRFVFGSQNAAERGKLIRRKNFRIL
jgi:hypothetical protein